MLITITFNIIFTIRKFQY